MNPKGAVATDTVEFEALLFKGSLDVLGTFELFAGVSILKHVIAGLGASRASVLGKGKKAIESFRTVLCTFDTGMINGFFHNNPLTGFYWVAGKIPRNALEGNLISNQKKSPKNSIIDDFVGF
jgi:hypothetical protein